MAIRLANKLRLSILMIKGNTLWLEEEKKRIIGLACGSHTRRGSEVASRPGTV